MPEVAYLSSTGEVKIPLKVRTRLGLTIGQKFDVQIRGRDVMLVQLGLPSTEQVREFVAWAKGQPKRGPMRIQIGGTTKKRSRKSPPRKKATSRRAKRAVRKRR